MSADTINAIRLKTSKQTTIKSNSTRDVEYCCFHLYSDSSSIRCSIVSLNCDLLTPKFNAFISVSYCIVFVSLVTRKASYRWQTRATLAKRLHGLCESSGVVSCIARLPIRIACLRFPISVLYSNCICKMHRFGDTRLLKLPCPWKPGQGSLKVIESDTIR